MKLQEYVDNGSGSFTKMFTPGDFIIFTTGAGMYLDDNHTWNFHPGPLREESDWDAATTISDEKLSAMMKVVLQMGVMAVNRYPYVNEVFITPKKIDNLKPVMSRSAVKLSIKLLTLVCTFVLCASLILVPDQISHRTICFMLAMVIFVQTNF